MVLTKKIIKGMLYIFYILSEKNLLFWWDDMFFVMAFPPDLKKDLFQSLF